MNIERMTRYYVGLADRHGVERVIRFLLSARPPDPARCLFAALGRKTRTPQSSDRGAARR